MNRNALLAAVLPVVAGFSAVVSISAPQAADPLDRKVSVPDSRFDGWSLRELQHQARHAVAESFTKDEFLALGKAVGVHIASRWTKEKMAAALNAAFPGADRAAA